MTSQLNNLDEIVAAALSEMAAMASAEFRATHPDIAAEAVDALAWCYTFDYK